ncbi:hypothetical protein H0O02_02540 [Candidatus Micrarchaeota archaeon]|nr:hypothetical protein [Candidatus Micrarchaeota archaeon]
MVEEAIKEAKEYQNKAQLLRGLPKKIMYQTFLLILDYLERSNKIHIDKIDGKIVWIWNPRGVEQVLKKNLVIR